MKTCNYCKLELPIESFSKLKIAPDGLSYSCRSCDSIRGKEYRENHKTEMLALRIQNRDKIRERQKKYYLVNKDQHQKSKDDYRSSYKGKYCQWKNGARVNNRVFDIILEDIMDMPLICHYTGVKLTLECNQDNTVSLDRIDSSKGYTKDNVVLCCAFVNAMKSDMSYETFISTCQAIAKRKEILLTFYKVVV